MKIFGLTIFEKKKPKLYMGVNYSFDHTVSAYFEKYYTQKHKRTFKRIQEDIEKKYKELKTGKKAIIIVKPYIEIRLTPYRG